MSASKTGLNRRIFLLAVLVQVILIPAFMYGVLASLKKEYQDQFVNYARSYSLSLLQSLSRSSSNDDLVNALQDIEFGGQTSFLQFKVEGQFSGHFKSYGSVTKQVEEDFAFGEHGDDNYYVFAPLEIVSLGTVGELVLGYDESLVRSKISRLYYYGTAIALGYFLLFLGIASILGKLVIRSQQKLEKIQIKQQEAEEANKAKSEFLAVMSHEIRTPLGGVIGMLELLQQERPEAERKYYLQLAQGSAQTLLHILDDILDAAKVESGKMLIEQIPFSFEQEMSYVLEAMRVRAQSKQIALQWSFPSTLPPILIGDPTRTKQIMANLLSNALKFTKEGGVIVTYQCELINSNSANIKIIVADTGIGIPAAVLPTLFEKFVQVDASTTRQFGGTGLGLSIIKSMVERMGGSVHVTSDYGHGTTFTVSIPFEISERPSLGTENCEEPMLESNHVAYQRLKLLCAEDDPVNKEYLRSLLNDLGVTATFVENGLEAVNLLKKENFDLVLMDNRMPVMDGFQATRAIRDIKNDVLDPHIPIVAVTANASAKYREACLAAGMNDYLTKPLRRSELKPILERIARLVITDTNAITGASSVTAIKGLSESELLAMLSDGDESASGENIALLTDDGEAKFTVSPALVQFYMQETPRRIQDMYTALQTKDFATLGRAAHTIKGSSYYVAADDLSLLSGKIQCLADNNSEDGVLALIESVQKHFNELQIRLSAIIVERA